jgi:hypothetical protein
MLLSVIAAASALPAAAQVSASIQTTFSSGATIQGNNGQKKPKRMIRFGTLLSHYRI